MNPAPFEPCANCRRIRAEAGPWIRVGLCEACKLRLAESGGEHPAPWRWVDAGGRELLIDGRGQYVLLADDGTSDGIPIKTDPVAKAIIAAAPEMEAILREMYESQAIVMDGETDEARDHRRAGMRRWFDKIAPILACIDTARPPA